MKEYELPIERTIKMAGFKYKVVAEGLIDRIKEGAFAPGERIPTEPELCEMFNVGRQTVRKAVDLLVEQDILKRIQGSGTYVCKTQDTEDFSDRTPKKSFPVSETGNKNISMVLMNGESYIFLDVMRGVSNYLLERGYILNTIITDGDYEKERLALESLLASPPAGILFEPVNSGMLSVNYDLYQKISATIPCVLLHRDPSTLFPAVSLNDEEGTKLVTDYLVSLGHKNIGGLFSFQECTGQNRFMGYAKSIRDHGLRINPEYVVWASHDRMDDLFNERGNIGLERMLEKVTAVVCHDDRVASNLINYLIHKGKRVPEDYSVVGYDDSPFATMGVPITTVTHPKSEYGVMGAKALLELISDPENVDFSIYKATPKLVIRSSTAEYII